MLKKLFKIWDCQNWRYFADGQWFDRQEAICCLADYHDVDYTGVKNDGKDTPYKNIYEFLDTFFHTEVDKLDWLLEYGDWDLHYYIYHDTKDDVIAGGEWDNEEKVKEHLAEDKNLVVECRYKLK